MAELLPGPAPAPAPAAETYLGEAPTIGELAELSLKALVQPGAAFQDLRFRPSPGLGSSLLLFGSWVFLGNVLTVLVLFMRQSGAGLLPLLLGLAAATVVLAPMGLLGAGVLHVLALCSGGKETFARSMAALALLGGLVPVSAASAAFLPGPYSALLPTAYGTYLLVRTVALLHHAPAVQAWIVFGTCGVLAGAGQIRFQQTIAVLQSQLEMMANLYSTNPLAAAQAASQAQGAAAALPGQQNLPPAVPDMAGVQALADQAKSSLDMVAQPGAGAALGNMPTLPAGPDGGPAIPGAGASGAQMQQLGQMSAAMMSALNQQLAANPNAMNAMSPQQRQQMQQLMQMANQMTAQIQQGRMPTAQDRQNIQQALRGMGPAVQPLDGAEIETAPAPRPAARRRRRRPAPQTQAPAYE